MRDMRKDLKRNVPYYPMSEHMLCSANGRGGNCGKPAVSVRLENHDRMELGYLFSRCAEHEARRAA